jgi:hypothetical protein
MLALAGSLSAGTSFGQATLSPQVRAEVSDRGMVLYIKTISDEARGSHQRMSGQMLAPSEGGRRAACRLH